MTNRAIPIDERAQWASDDAEWFTKSRRNLLRIREPFPGEVDDSAASYLPEAREKWWIVVRFVAGGKGAVAAKTPVLLEGNPPLSYADDQIIKLLRHNQHRTPVGAVVL